MRLQASLLACVALSFLSCAAAQTYYVSTTGSNPACTQATPCGTLLVATTLAAGTTATIVMNPGTYTTAGNYGLSFGAVSNQRITINGTGAIIDCGGNGGFTVAGSQTLGLSINGLTMRNCRPALKFDGAAADGTFSGMTFDSNGQLGVSSAVTLRPQSAGSLFRPTFTQCTFKNNVGLNGGALQISAPPPAGVPIPANIIMDNCTFINNTATAGGALHATSCCDRGSTFLTRLTFSGNSATLAGAAVYFSSLLGTTAGASADIEDWGVDSSALTAPTSSNAAGVLHIQGSTRSLNRVTISNSAITSSAGGLSSAALYVSGSTVSVSNLVMTNNHVTGSTFADTAGASLLVSSSTITVSNAQISGAVIGNSASPSGRGAAIAFFAGASGVTGSMSDSIVSGNRAGDGAGLYASSIGQFTFTNVSFSGNTGFRGAAAYLATGSAITFTDCPMSGNTLLAPQTTAQGFGGAVAVFDASNATLSGGALTLNSASYGGGAVYAAANSRLVISNVAFQNNSAAIVGGAIMLGANPAQPSVAAITATITGSSFTANRASSGGAIYSSSVAAITIGTTTFTDNAASGSPQSQGGAIYVAGNNTVPVSLTLNAQTTFVGNAAPAGASLSLFGVSASLGGATLPAPPSQTACCGTRCIVCDTPSGNALTSSAGVKCPDTACPTLPPPPPTTRPASAASGFVPAVAIVAALLVGVCLGV